MKKAGRKGAKVPRRFPRVGTSLLGTALKSARAAEKGEQPFQFAMGPQFVRTANVPGARAEPERSDSTNDVQVQKPEIAGKEKPEKKILPGGEEEMDAQDLAAWKDERDRKRLPASAKRPTPRGVRKGLRLAPPEQRKRIAGPSAVKALQRSSQRRLPPPRKMLAPPR